MLLLPVFDNNYTLAAFLAWPCFSPEHNHCVLVEILGRDRERKKKETRWERGKKEAQRKERGGEIAARTRFPSREFVSLELSGLEISRNIFRSIIYILRRIFREAVGRNHLNNRCEARIYIYIYIHEEDGCLLESKRSEIERCNFLLPSP